jgi:RNase P/RNase MRP subunit p29
MQGTIIDESKHFFTINKAISESSEVTAKVEKKNCTFRFRLPSDELVDIDGDILDSSSENRLKIKIRKRW